MNTKKNFLIQTFIILVLLQIAEMMTPSEKLQLEKVQEKIKNLGMNEFCVEETLFLFKMYLRYHR